MTPGSSPPDTDPRALSRPTVRGRTRILPQALRQIVSVVTAESLGVAPDHVSVVITDDHGMLRLTIKAPIRAVSLLQVSRDPAVVGRAGGTILERSHASQIEIRRRVGELTGSDIGQVTVRLTRVNISPERRLQ